MKHNTLPTMAAALLLATVVAQDVQAQSKPEPRVVSRDELRACMDAESSIASKRKAIDQIKESNRAEAEAIKAEATEMNAEQQKLQENPDERKERAFKRKVSAHNDRVKAANAQVEAFRTQAEDMNKSAIAYNEKCGGISFMKEDKDAILKEREAAGK